MSFDNILKDRISLINKNLEICINDKFQSSNSKVILDAMLYSLRAGGKRLRPILLLSACEAVGGNLDEALPFACAIEMIHTYSLIHDDLPSMDNDDFRRGKPTCHKVFGEAIAILAGDGLLNTAFEVMTEAIDNNFEKRFLKACKIIGNYSGIHGMIGGQVADIVFENKKIDSETLIYIHEHKTAALIKASLKAGAIIGGASDSHIDLFDSIGYKLGIAFQIKDDILDVTSTTEVLGKPVFSDEKNSKTTYVSLYGIEKANSEFVRISTEAEEDIKTLGEKGDFFLQYSKMLIDRKK